MISLKRVPQRTTADDRRFDQALDRALSDSSSVECDAFDREIMIAHRLAEALAPLRVLPPTVDDRIRASIEERITMRESARQRWPWRKVPKRAAIAFVVALALLAGAFGPLREEVTHAASTAVLHVKAIEFFNPDGKGLRVVILNGSNGSQVEGGEVELVPVDQLDGTAPAPQDEGESPGREHGR